MADEVLGQAQAAQHTLNSQVTGNGLRNGRRNDHRNGRRNGRPRSRVMFDATVLVTIFGTVDVTTGVTVGVMAGPSPSLNSQRVGFDDTVPLRFHFGYISVTLRLQWAGFDDTHGSITVPLRFHYGSITVTAGGIRRYGLEAQADLDARAARQLATWRHRQVISSSAHQLISSSAHQ